ncbi:MAG: VOC family protein [bacterium]
MKLRQVAIAADTLNPTRSQIFNLLGIRADYADPGVAEFGLENSVMTVGEGFLEIVAPTQENTSAGRLLAKRQATCGYMVLMQVDNFAATAQHLAQQQVRSIWQVDRAEVSACHVHPKDMGGAIVSFDEMRPAHEWLWAGPDWRSRRASNVNSLLGCDLAHPDPLDLAGRWGEIMRTPVTRQSGECFALIFSDNSFIRFRPAAADLGITGITFTCPNPQHITAQARALGLWDEVRDGIFIGDVAFNFV